MRIPKDSGVRIAGNGCDMRGRYSRKRSLRRGQQLAETFEHMMGDPRGNTFLQWAVERRKTGWTPEQTAHERAAILEQ